MRSYVRPQAPKEQEPNLTSAGRLTTFRMWTNGMHKQKSRVNALRVALGLKKTDLDREIEVDQLEAAMRKLVGE